MEDDGQGGGGVAGDRGGDAGGVAGEGRQDTVGLALALSSHPGEWGGGNAQVGRFSGKNINLRGRGGDGDIKTSIMTVTTICRFSR